MPYTDPRVWSGVSQSTNKPHPAAFLVYINGIEVPAKSVSQRYGVWQIPEMQIEMVADPVLSRIGAEDRIQVVVFYLDDTQPDESVKPQFRLFGEGEIYAWGYQNTPGGRSIVFTVVNQVNILTQLFVQFLTQVDDYAAYEIRENTSAFGIASSTITFPYSLFTDGLLRTETARSPTSGGANLSGKVYAGGATDVNNLAAQRVIAFARTFLGTPYVTGGKTPGVEADCSGLVSASYKSIGVRVVHKAREIRLTVGREVPRKNKKGRITTADLAPADIVYADCTPGAHDHVGIYDGRGNVIHAGSKNKFVMSETLAKCRWVDGAKRILPGVLVAPKEPRTPAVVIEPDPNDFEIDYADLDESGRSLYARIQEGVKEWTGVDIPPIDNANAITAQTIGAGVPSEQIPNAIQRPFDYLFNVIKAMMEKKVPSTVRTIPAANFFVRWARLSNFVNRFTAFPIFDEVYDVNVFPPLKALQGVNALDVMVQKLLPQMQNAGSLWDMLQLVYQQVFMEVAMMPMMPLVTADLATGLIEDTSFDSHTLKEDPDNPATYITANPLIPLKPNRIPNYFAKPQFLFGLPPSCNVIFPSQIKVFNYTESFMQQPTRLYLNDETANNLLKSRGVNQVAISNALATGYPPEVDINNQIRVQGGNVNGKNFLLYPEEFFKGPVMDRRTAPPWLFFLRQAEYAKQNPLAPGVFPTGTPTVDGAPSSSGQGTTTPPSPATASAAANDLAGYVWPLAKAEDGRRPFSLTDYKDHLGNSHPRGDGYATAGVDLYYPRNPDEIYLPEAERAFDYFQNERYYKDTSIPLGTMCLAVGPGEVIQAAPEATGFSVRILHAGGQWITYYTNMRVGSQKVKQGDKVVAGTPLGEVGYDPRDPEKVYHVHFSLYQAANAKHAVDPAPAMAKWAILNAPVLSTTRRKDAPATATIAQPMATPPLTIDAMPTIDPAVYARLKEENENVYMLYAKYEFYRERYAKRSGSASMSWNPYVVPGFPAAFFDQRATRVDVFAYITTVQHRMSWRERATDVTFIYGRTIQETFSLLRHEFNRGSAMLGTAPQEPIKDIRKIVQDFTQAEDMYQRLFYGGKSLYGKDASFDWRRIIGFAPKISGGLPEAIYMAGRDEASNDAYVAAAQSIVALQPEVAKLYEAQTKAQLEWDTGKAALEAIDDPAGFGTYAGYGRANADAYLKVAAQTVEVRRDKIVRAMHVADRDVRGIKRQLAALAEQMTLAVRIVEATENTVNAVGTGVVSNVVGDREIVPLPAAEPMFNEYDSAMNYNWRPICTLDEYIIFHDAAGEGAIPAAGHERSLGARYFTRIRRMTPLTADYTFPTGADGLQVPPDPVIPLTAEVDNWSIDDYIVTPETSEPRTGLGKGVKKVFLAARAALGDSPAYAEALWTATAPGGDTPVSSRTEPFPEEQLSWATKWFKKYDLAALSRQADKADLQSKADRLAWALQFFKSDDEKYATLVALLEAQHAEAVADTQLSEGLKSPTEGMLNVPGLKSGTAKHGRNSKNDFPQTRADWDTILLAYRNNVYNVKAPKG